MALLVADTNPEDMIGAADHAMYARKTGAPGVTVLRNDVRRELIFDTADLVAQH